MLDIDKGNSNWDNLYFKFLKNSLLYIILVFSLVLILINYSIEFLD